MCECMRKEEREIESEKEKRKTGDYVIFNSACRGHKQISDLLELEFQAILRQHNLGANKPGFSED